MTGKQISHFEIIHRIGEGGMGVVYLARDVNLGRQVAIKLLPEENTKDPDSLRRFLAEAKAASALNHPNIVTVYEVSQDGGQWFIAMEYVQGKTLGESIPPDGLPLQQALKFASQTADALACAHASGVIHRDVKPGNIMVTTAGTVKVLDFGLAKLVTQAGPQDQTVRAEAATVPGTILGTFDYMSPEQAEGKEAGPRSDIFSFGAVLYEMLIGRKAFHRDSHAGTLTAVMRDDPAPVSESRKDLPRELDGIVALCLRKKADERAGSMGEVHEALERMRQPSERMVVASPRSAPSYWKAVAAVAVLVAAGVSAALYFRAPSSDPPPSMRSLPLTAYPGSESSASFSPDGKQVAFSWNGEKQDNLDIYVKYLDSPSPLRLTKEPGADYSPLWSPDGRWIAFLRRSKVGRGIYLVSPHGSDERSIFQTSAGLGSRLSWSPDGRFLVFSLRPERDGAFSIHRLDLESGKVARITSPASGELGDLEAAISPDGRTLLFARTSGNVSVARLLAVDLTANGEPRGDPVSLLSGFFAPASLVWVPGQSNRVLFVSSYSSLYSAWQSRITGSGPQRQLERPKRIEALNGAERVALSPAGPPFALAYEISKQDVNLHTISLPDGALSPTPLGGSSFTEEAASYSPDGRMIAFRSSRDGEINLWISNSDGTSARQLTRYRSHNIGSASWSTDGRHIGFGLTSGGDFNLLKVDVNSGAIEELLATPAMENGPRWSPDGRWIYFTSDRSGQQQIWRMPSAGGTPQQITTAGGANPKFSHDGRFLYYRLDQGPLGSLWRMAAEGGTAERVVESVVWSNWAAVADGLYYSDMRTVWFLPSSSNSARRVAALNVRIGSGFDVHPDGKRLLITVFDGDSGRELMYVPDFR